MGRLTIRPSALSGFLAVDFSHLCGSVLTVALLPRQVAVVAEVGQGGRMVGLCTPHIKPPIPLQL